jgi:hypothetical protein
MFVQGGMWGGMGGDFDFGAMMEKFMTNMEEWNRFKDGEMSDEEAAAYQARVTEKCPWMKKMQAKADAGEIDDTFPFEKSANEMKKNKMMMSGGQNKVCKTIEKKMQCMYLY